MSRHPIWVIVRADTAMMLESFDPDWVPKPETKRRYWPKSPEWLRGWATWTMHEDRAMRFETAAAAVACYQTQSKSCPVRADGRPNRPLTSFTVLVQEIDDERIPMRQAPGADNVMALAREMGLGQHEMLVVFRTDDGSLGVPAVTVVKEVPDEDAAERTLSQVGDEMRRELAVDQLVLGCWRNGSLAIVFEEQRS